jgi:hypothetical protein
MRRNMAEKNETIEVHAQASLRNMRSANTHQTVSLKPPFTKVRAIPPTSALSASQTSLFNAVAQQPVLDTATNIPLTALESLPTITGRPSENVDLANDAPEKFLQEALNLDRLNRIHGHLWMAGRPMRARPLHRYKMLLFEILHTQQMDLHLLHFNDKLMIKPLPEWLLCADFWSKHLCHNRKLHASACGFLLSYVWLIVTPLDLKIAHDMSLLPSFVTWHWWKDMVKDFLGHVNINTLAQVNERYQFGDLRLGRINSIYRSRFFFTHFVRGYLYGYNRYAVFFQRNFSWIVTMFVFFGLVLTAMQVGLGLDELKSNHAFLRGSLVVVIFSMVSVLAAIGIIGLITTMIFLFNMVAAISHAASKQKQRRKAAKNSLDDKEQ